MVNGDVCISRLQPTGSATFCASPLDKKVKTQAEVGVVRVYRGDSVLDKLKELAANVKR